MTATPPTSNKKSKRKKKKKTEKKREMQKISKKDKHINVNSQGQFSENLHSKTQQIINLGSKVTNLRLSKQTLKWPPNKKNRNVCWKTKQKSLIRNTDSRFVKRQSKIRPEKNIY